MNISRNTILIGSAVILLIILSIVLYIRKDNYKLESPHMPQYLSSGGIEATYTQAYIDPPNLLKLPPYKKLYPAGKQPLNEYSGYPLSMYNGTEKLNAEYTPDLLWCKQHI